MNKKIIALAVAAAVTVPVVASADSAVIYGKMHYSWDFSDTNNATGDASDDQTGVAKSSRIGFKGSEDLGDGMKAIWQVESTVPNSAIGSRNTFVGLAGGFGTLVLGRHDTPYKIGTGKLDIFGDTAGDYQNIIGSTNGSRNVFDVRASQTVAYITPTMSGFHAAIARISVKNVEVGAANNQDAWSATGIYSNGPLFASLSYETHDGGIVRPGADEKAWKLGLGYTIGDGKIGFIYEDISQDGSTANERSAYLINYAHKFGANTFKIAYGVAGDSDVANADDGAKNWTVGLDHAFSKRTKVYGLYSAMSNDTGAAYSINGTTGTVAGRDVDVFSAGIVHTF